MSTITDLHEARHAVSDATDKFSAATQILEYIKNVVETATRNIENAKNNVEDGQGSLAAVKEWLEEFSEKLAELGALESLQGHISSAMQLAEEALSACGTADTEIGEFSDGMQATSDKGDTSMQTVSALKDKTNELQSGLAPLE